MKKKIIAGALALASAAGAWLWSGEKPKAPQGPTPAEQKAAAFKSCLKEGLEPLGFKGGAIAEFTPDKSAITKSQARFERKDRDGNDKLLIAVGTYRRGPDDELAWAASDRHPVDALAYRGPVETLGQRFESLKQVVGHVRATEKYCKGRTTPPSPRDCAVGALKAARSQYGGPDVRPEAIIGDDGKIIPTLDYGYDVRPRMNSRMDYRVHLSSDKIEVRPLTGVAMVKDGKMSPSDVGDAFKRESANNLHTLGKKGLEVVARCMRNNFAPKPGG